MEDPEPIPTLALRAQVPVDTLVTWLGQDRFTSIDFDTADRLFGAMGVTHLWWTTYSEYYYAVNLRMEQCAHPACSVMFERPEEPTCSMEGCDEPHHSRGFCHTHHEAVRYRAKKVAGVLGTTLLAVLDEHFPKVGHGIQPERRQYCSHACAMSHGSARRAGRGDMAGRKKKWVVGKTCRNGHPRTPENTKTRSGGRTECAVCARNAAKRCYDKKHQRAA